MLWQRIELETLDILTMVHHAIADRVDLRKKLIFPSYATIPRA